MQNVIDAAAGLVHCVEIGDVSLAEVDAVENVRKVLVLSGGKVVDAANLFSPGNQCASDRGADKASNTSNQIKSHGRNMITNRYT